MNNVYGPGLDDQTHCYEVCCLSGHLETDINLACDFLTCPRCSIHISYSYSLGQALSHQVNIEHLVTVTIDDKNRATAFHKYNYSTAILSSVAYDICRVNLLIIVCPYFCICMLFPCVIFLFLLYFQPIT